MDSTLWPSFLMWCALFNFVLLPLAFTGFILVHDWLFRLHSRWFALPVAEFDAIAFFIFGLHKFAIWFFLIIPALTIWYMRQA